jgi:hypothetical protein
VPHENRLVDLESTDNGQNVFPQTVDTLFQRSIRRCAEPAAGDTVHVVIGCQLGSEHVEHMRRVSATRKKDHRSA